MPIIIEDQRRITISSLPILLDIYTHISVLVVAKILIMNTIIIILMSIKHGTWSPMAVTFYTIYYKVFKRTT
jgi:hypothetical protein